MTETVATQVKAIAFDREIENLTKGFTGREWVFAEIDRWLQQSNERFFILTGEPGVGKSAIAAQLTQTRQDIAAYHFCIARQISTIEPTNVLLSLAAQLIKSFPDYGEALVNTVKPLLLHINVDITIETIKDSVVQGVVIENLHTQYPQQTLDIVLRQALTALPKPPKAPIAILIDSLDGAATYGSENNLVTLLSSVDDLPPWVRFILTSRPDKQRVLSYFKTLKPCYYHLNERSDKSKQDIYRYVDRRVTSEPIQIQIQRSQILSEALINQITELSQGNFLYTKVLLDDIELGGQSINNLAALPKSLNEFYYNFLLRLKAEWEAKYQLIFGILTVTKAPMTEVELANLLSEQLSETELGQRLGVVQQFLDIVQNDRAESTYTVFHQTLKDYLIDKEKSGVFYCSPKDGHRQIVEYCWQYHPGDWRDCDRYGLQCLFMHLVDMAALEKPPVKARKYIEKIHELLAIEVDGRNAWFTAKDSQGDTLGFLADVTLAWQIAEQEFITSQSPQSIVLQCRYALITSSVKSLTGNIPTELAIELLKRDSAQGFTCFQKLVFNKQINLEMLSELELQTLEPKLVQKLLEVVENISNKSYQVQLKSALAQCFPEVLWKLLEALRAIENEKDKARALGLLTPYLSLDQRSKALEIIEQMSDEVRSQALSLMPQSLQQSPELITNVLAMTQKVYGQYRANVLIGLAPYLPEALLPEALTIALDIDDPEANEYSRTRSLSGLATAPRLHSDLIEKIQQQIETFQEQDNKTQVLCALAPHLPLDQLDKNLEKVQTLEYEFRKAEILSDLALRLPSTQLPKILQALQAVEDESHKANILNALTPLLPPEQLPEILQTVQAFNDEVSQALVLAGFATIPNLTADLIENIQQQVEPFQNQDNKTQVLSALAPYLPSDQLCRILQDIQIIEDRSSQTKTLRYFLAQLPSDQREQALQVGELSEAVRSIDHLHYRYWTPGDLTICLPLDQLHKTLQAIETLDNEYEQALALSGFATTPDLTADLLDKIQQRAESFQNQNNKTKVLSALAPRLSFDRLPKILQALQAMESSYDQAQALSTLAFNLPPAQLHQVLKAIQTLSDQDYQVRVLGALAYRLASDSQDNQLHQKHKTQVLSALAPHLSSDQLPQVLQEILAFEDDSRKAWAFSALAPHLQIDELPELLKVTQSIQNEFERADALRVLAVALAKFPHTDLHPLWVEMLHGLASRSRRDLLSDLRELTPIISSLGKVEAIAALCHVIKDIGRQWT